MKAGFFWSPDGIRERTSEVPSPGDPHDGTEVEASDVIESALPPLAFPSADARIVKLIVPNVF